MANSTVSSTLTVSDLRDLSLGMLGRALRKFSLSDDAGAASIRREPPPLLRLRTEEEEAAALRLLVNQIREERPLDALSLDIAQANRIIQSILNSGNVKDALASLTEVSAFIATLPPAAKKAVPARSLFKTVVAGESFTVDASAALVPRKEIADALESEIAQQSFVASVMQLCFERRAEGNVIYSGDEEIAVERAYRLLDEGVRLPRVFKPILHDSRRHIQTYLSFADPGDGHLAVTVRDSKLLKGLIVHIEYIDRDGVDNKELVEAYRLPAIRNAARVCLHVGDETPCTAFIGRPVFEGENFDLGLLKAGHTMASVCSAMFAQGVADCKVAMDHMTARQAVDFMRIVAGNVVRIPLKQSLSAAFNINSPLKDDLLSRGAAREIKNPLEIAATAVRLVTMGRFNKIAWDGASNDRSGNPILIGQIKRAELLKLVHEAHAHGLETYISAGMEPHHMRDAVYVGVGGVGIGTKLHHLAADKTIGEIDPKKVTAALDIQRLATRTTPGKAAAQLAQMDWQYAEGSLLPSLKVLREELYQALLEYLSQIDMADAMPANPAKAPAPSEAKLQELLVRIAALQAPPGVSNGVHVSPQSDEEPVASSAKSGGRKARLGAAPARAGGAAAAALTRDPVEMWAQRVLAAYAEEPKESMMSGPVIERIRQLLEAGDLQGLRALYPL